jgi:hypothetical protein
MPESQVTFYFILLLTLSSFFLEFSSLIGINTWSPDEKIIAAIVSGIHRRGELDFFVSVWSDKFYYHCTFPGELQASIGNNKFYSAFIEPVSVMAPV